MKEQKRKATTKGQAKEKQRFRAILHTEISIKFLTFAYNIVYNTDLNYSGVINAIIKEYLEKHEKVKKKYEEIVKI